MINQEWAKTFVVAIHEAVRAGSDPRRIRYRASAWPQPEEVFRSELIRFLAERRTETVRTKGYDLLMWLEGQDVRLIKDILILGLASVPDDPAKGEE